MGSTWWNSAEKKFIFGFVFLFGMGWAKAQVLSTQEYIDMYKYAAMQEMKVYGIPASVTLGQGILESASGNSKLARQCNNHFGIKCRKDWTGAFCLADDDAPNECFRGYPSAMESYRDHSLFLKGSARYSSLFSLSVIDYKGWAQGLRQAGYATNPAYSNILIGIIEKYRLAMYDSMVLLGSDYKSPDTTAQRVVQINGLPAVYVKAGQTQKDIAEEQNMGTWQIRRYNDLKRGENLDPGEIIYLKPKRRKGSVAEITVQKGQDMHEISQIYGIKLKKLYRNNRLKRGTEVRPGEVLYLQNKREKAPATIDHVEKKPEPTAAPVLKKRPDTAYLNQGFYEVKPGETLYSIAVKQGVTVEELRLWNNLQGTDLKAGQVLILKRNLKANSADSGSRQNVIQQSVRFHVVVSGETLFSISRLYNKSLDSLILWNKLPSTAIYPGQEIILVAPTTSTSENNSIPKTYSVQPGDTLYFISRKFGVSVAEIRKINKLNSDNLIPGQTLLLQ